MYSNDLFPLIADRLIIGGAWLNQQLATCLSKVGRANLGKDGNTPCRQQGSLSGHWQFLSRPSSGALSSHD